MKNVGIIGGFGPQTTLEFQAVVHSRWQSRDIHVRPEMITWNAPVTHNLEKKLLFQNDGLEEFVPHLIHGAQLLEKAGADFLVLPCNTLHILEEHIKKAVHIPFLSLIDVTVVHLLETGVKTICLLATETSIHQKLHQNTLNESGIKTTIPNEKIQAKINQLIFNLVNQNQRNTTQQKFDSIINDLKMDGNHRFLLGCTDLTQLSAPKEEVEFFDTVSILADATVKEMLK